MVEPTGQVFLAEDWRDREDGLQLVVEALLSAYRYDDIPGLINFVDIGHELSFHGLEFAAATIAHAAAQKLLGNELVDLVPEDFTNPGALPELARELADRAPDSDLYGRLLGLIADIYRHVGMSERAIQAYKDAAAMFDRLGRLAPAATARQSLGALHFYLGDLDQAEELTKQAEVIFTKLSDRQGLVEVRLNQVEYALQREDVAQATSLLDSVATPISELRDGHLSASWRAHSALVDIQQGEVDAAREKLLAALRSCRRRQDLELEVVVLQNLAKLTRDTRGPSASLRWARQALLVAQRLKERDREQSLARSLAVDLIDTGKFEEAIELLQRTVEINIELDSPLDAAQAQADLGAALLSKALGVAETNADILAIRERDHLLEQGIVTLTGAFEKLDQFEDYEWATRCAGNLRIAWTAQDRADFGVGYLERYAEKARVRAPTYSASLLRIAAFLGLTAKRDMSWAIMRLQEAAEASSSDPVDRAWQLVADASRINSSYNELEGALAIYDKALDTLRHSSDQIGYANVLNDSALIAAALDHLDDARIRLHEVESLAIKSGNRALDALAKGNLGELSLRGNQQEIGREYLTAAATLAAAVGDVEGASTAWSSIANSLVNSDEGLDLAKEAAANAAEYAEQSGSTDANARSTSALASIRFAEGDYLEAFELWRDASRSGPAEKSATYQGFALDALAHGGDWTRYSRELDKFTRAAQRSGTQMEFGEELWTSAMTWLRTQSARRAAKPLSYSVLLAAEGYTKRDKNPLDESQVAKDMSALVSTAKTFAAAHTFMELEDVPPALRDALNRHMTAQMAKIVGLSDAEMLMAQVAEVGRWRDEPLS
ncbi:hypothetical protein OVN18_05860 [Microcella daejeonensis]|uniref:Tetratricopeptide repeat protein n=1 Tax=Microcella daejeonensis TaxID=2994971 RepID=A0A9E8MN30_9MICO|nr:hypothetical protein [Microcella daejeonensis]WAB82526.1 hypothetical protein OVN18_05860 [Microcella daejeonensis]